jgi:hypothetical protein
VAQHKVPKGLAVEVYAGGIANVRSLRVGDDDLRNLATSLTKLPPPKPAAGPLDEEAYALMLSVHETWLRSALQGSLVCNMRASHAPARSIRSRQSTM